MEGVAEVLKFGVVLHHFLVFLLRRVDGGVGGECLIHFHDKMQGSVLQFSAQEIQDALLPLRERFGGIAVGHRQFHGIILTQNGLGHREDVGHAGLFGLYALDIGLPLLFQGELAEVFVGCRGSRFLRGGGFRLGLC